jgi:predicted porin
LAPLKIGLFLSNLLAATGLAQAQSATAPADDSLTYHGITLYGIVDVGIQNQSHGAPINDYFVGGSAEIVQKNSNHSVTGITPSNLSNSRIGLQGVEPIVGDWSGVFKLETFFNPQSGEISDALKSLAQNNGRALANQTTNVDSSASGQPFIQSFAGFSSKTVGTFTFGRQNTVLADGIAKYDPNFASQAFSLIGISGTTAGGGDTQNRRLDSSVKYVGSFSAEAGGGAHLAAQYKFNQSRGSAGSAFQVSIGGEFAGASLDAYYTKINDAVSIASLSAAQLRGGKPGQCIGRHGLRQHNFCHLGSVQPRRGEVLWRLRAHQIRESGQPDERRLRRRRLHDRLRQRSKRPKVDLCQRQDIGSVLGRRALHGYSTAGFSRRLLRL